MPTLTVNGQQVEVPQGASVLDAVLRSEVELPHLCKDSDMGAIGACRTCLVQVEGQRGFPASCSLPAAEGMAVLTETPDVHPTDAEGLGLADGEWVRVRSRRGDLEGRAQISEMVKEGELFVPFVKLAEHAANFLTNNVLDPTSKIPEYKVCAVRIEKIGESDRDALPRRGRSRRQT